MHPDKSVRSKHIEILQQAYDEYLRLTGISYIVMNRDGLSIIQKLSSEINTIRHDEPEKVMNYDKIASVRSAIDRAYDNMIEVAKNDLQKI